MDNERIDRITKKHGNRPGSLIQVLLEIQHENHWLPRDVLDSVSRKLGVPLSRTLQIVTFYKTFRLFPEGRHDVQVCGGPSCFVRGSTRLLDAVREHIQTGPGETNPDSTVSLETGICHGCCHLGPEMRVDGKHHVRLSPGKVKDVLKNLD